MAVKWRDAYHDDTDLSDVELAQIGDCAVTLTVGYLARKTRTALYIAQNYVLESEGRLPSWRFITVIPRAMVMSESVVRR